MVHGIRWEYKLVRQGPSYPPAVWARHKDGMVKGVKHEHVDLVVMGYMEVDWLGIPQPANTIWWGDDDVALGG